MPLKTTGQGPGSDDEWGAGPIHQRVNFSGPLGNLFNASGLSKVTMNEMPAFTNRLLSTRGGIENKVNQKHQIFVQIVTLGWQRNAAAPPAGGIWAIMDDVSVISPMLIMNGEVLKLMAVTFSQDLQTGTRSTLELYNEAARGAPPETRGGG